ncbi:MAG: RNA polymerase-associated protein RapA [Gammaproteobacteria bacterium]
MLDCRPGQRWISNTEPELGLGIVFEVVDRRVVMTFPASEQRRTYALDNAPLTRVRYRVADRVRAEDGSELIVGSYTEVEGCVIYHGVDARGERVDLHEIDLDSFVQFNRPLDRLFTGQFDRAPRFRLRAATLANQHALQVAPARGLLGPRVQLLPHQFYIADEVSSRHAPRVLLADEVGLGKTIEAGLVLHRLLLLGRVRRALVLLPDNLVHQWLVEMLRRFNLQFSIIDEGIADELEESGEDNPFESAQLVLAPLRLLARSRERLAQAAAAGWDLLIVDEAHHLAWSEDAVSAEYEAVAVIAARVPALLLLTATPEQLGVSGHFARLALLDPHRYDDLGAYLDEEHRYGAVSALVDALISGAAAPSPALLAEAATYLGQARVDELAAGDPAGFSARLVRELLDHHGTGRVLFRNCRENIEGFPPRRLATYPLPLPPRYREGAARLPVAAQLTPEQELGEEWLTLDPRVEWLSEWLKAHRADKTLVICAAAGTAQDLESWLRLRRGLRTAVFHEGLDLVGRDRAAAYFADAEEDCSALVCSEIGSEGRNFQFARHLVLFDVPANPDLLEQRIGRLDRIGQQHTVEIHVPLFEDSAQAVLVRWLHEGIDAFEHICPAGPALFAEFAADLTACMENPTDQAALDALVSRTRTRTRAIVELLQRGRDRLLELNSLDRERAAEVIARVEAAARTDALRAYMDQVFDAFGVEHEEHGAMSLVLHPGDHMSCERFPGLPEGGLTVTFDRSEAQSRDDMHFLTWEHPMVTGAMDMVLGSEFGNASFGVVRSRELAPGTLIVECLFVIVCPAPPGLGLTRFLARSNLRVVVDGAGEDVTARFARAWLDAAVRDVPTATAQKVVMRMHDQIEQLVEHATHMGEVRQEGIVREAIARMRSELDEEIERLRQLARLNPNVREDEIAALADDRDACAHYLAAGQLKLDAVRVVVAT